MLGQLYLTVTVKQVIKPEDIWCSNRCIMCAIFSGHPKLCQQPNHSFIRGLLTPTSTKIRLSSTLTDCPLKIPSSWRQDVISCSLFLPFCVSNTQKVPTSSTNLHIKTHVSLLLCVCQTLIHSGISSGVCVWVQKVSQCQECFPHN